MTTDIKPVPTAAVKLPSRGLLYGDKMPGGDTSVTPMVYKDDMLLASESPDKAHIVDEIIQRHLDLKGLKYEDLLVGDKLYTLCMIRFISYGPEYRFKSRCHECQEYTERVVMVPEGLRGVYLTDQTGREPYEITLPASQRRVGLRHLRVSDERAIRSYVKEQQRGAVRSRNTGNPAYAHTLARSIATIDGMPVENVAQAMLFLQDDGFLSRDSIEIENGIADLHCGPSLINDFECSHCFAENQSTIEFTSEFFRPGRRQRDGQRVV